VIWKKTTLWAFKPFHIPFFSLGVLLLVHPFLFVLGASNEAEEDSYSDRHIATSSGHVGDSLLEGWENVVLYTMIS
jgi:hypothetical protein